MSNVVLVAHKDKCRTYGKCLKVAPDLFTLDENDKVEVAPSPVEAGEAALKGAKSCPYRAISVLDEGTGEQLFPAVRKAAG
jgi:ferredoxin